MQKYKFYAIFMIFTPLVASAPLVAFVAFFKMAYMNVEYPTYKDTQLKTAQNHSAQIIILGDSRAKAGFIPPDSAFLNLAIGGSTAISGYYTLKRYLAHNAPPKILILSFMAHHYLFDETFWERAIKFEYLGFDEFSEIMDNAQNLAQCKVFHHKGKCYKFNFFKYKLQLKNFAPEIYNAWRDFKNGRNRFAINMQIMADLAQNGGHFFYGRALESKDLNFEANQKSFRLNPLYDLYLQKIATLAVEHNIKIFHYQMPFNEASFDALDSAFVADYNAFLDSMQSAYGIISLNNIWALPNSDFGDPSHLYKGAHKTTADILEKINTWEAQKR
ncbi:hypothetical protein ACWIUD_00245 [Helicobacter sp. 23-1044]